MSIHVFRPPLDATKRAVQVPIVVSILAAVLWTAMAIPTSAAIVQRIDDSWHDAMVVWENPALVFCARAMGVIGGVWVNVPLCLLVALWLGRRKLWTRLWVWLLAVVPAQAVTTLAKGLYDRPRPQDALLELQSAAFPSGHAANAAAISLALVLVFVPRGLQRKRALMLAAGYTVLMALSRSYLRVHWLSDVTGGVLWGFSATLWSALLAPRLVGPRDRPPGGRSG